MESHDPREPCNQITTSSENAKDSSPHNCGGSDIMSSDMVFSRATDPGIAEDWDSCWESLYTLDDDTIYTHLTKREVIFEGLPPMPPPPNDNAKLSTALNYLIHRAKAYGVDKEELMEMVDMLKTKEKNTDPTKKRTASAIKKIRPAAADESIKLPATEHGKVQPPASKAPASPTTEEVQGEMQLLGFDSEQEEAKLPTSEDHVLCPPWMFSKRWVGQTTSGLANPVVRSEEAEAKPKSPTQKNGYIFPRLTRIDSLQKQNSVPLLRLYEQIGRLQEQKQNSVPVLRPSKRDLSAKEIRERALASLDSSEKPTTAVTEEIPFQFVADAAEIEPPGIGLREAQLPTSEEEGLRPPLKNKGKWTKATKEDCKPPQLDVTKPEDGSEEANSTVETAPTDLEPLKKQLFFTELETPPRSTTTSNVSSTPSPTTPTSKPSNIKCSSEKGTSTVASNSPSVTDPPKPSISNFMDLPSDKEEERIHKQRKRRWFLFWLLLPRFGSCRQRETKTKKKNVQTPLFYTPGKRPEDTSASQASSSSPITVEDSVSETMVEIDVSGGEESRAVRVARLDVVPECRSSEISC